jgi:hypothetical protein
MTFQAGNPEGSLLLFTTDIAGNPRRRRSGLSLPDKYSTIPDKYHDKPLVLTPSPSAARFKALQDTSFCRSIKRGDFHDTSLLLNMPGGARTQ